MNHELAVKVYALVIQDTSPYILFAQQILWASLNSKGSWVGQKAQSREILSDQK